MLARAAAASGVKLHALALVVLATARVHADPYTSNVVGDAEQRRRTPEAVTVYDTTQAKQEGADLAGVLDRIQGISIARTGGLGSDVRLSLNGLSNDQVRLYWNGLPLEIAGFAFGIASVPVNLVDRIEVYRGVVPIRFGADALGGAINLVTTDYAHGTGGSASVQAGSFGTLRATASTHWRDDRTSIYAAARAFVDDTRGDYDVHVQVPDSVGRLSDATVPLFHDAYASRGGSVDVGVVDAPWVKRLVARVFYSDYGEDLQTNPLMTVPYGAVGYDERLVGTSLELVQPNAFGRGIDLDSVVSYSHRTTDFHDTSSNVYDWLGNVIHQRPQPGEIDGSPHDVSLYRDSLFGRLGIDWTIGPRHALRLESTATYAVQHGVSRVGVLPGTSDPLASSRGLLKIVSGLEYRLRLFDRVQNTAFVKQYHVDAQATELLTGSVFSPVRLVHDSVGAGDGLRIRILGDRLAAKLSYEYATRLPGIVEVFGDGILVSPNGALRPERSHNANVGLQLDLRSTRVGDFDGELSAFVRAASDLILLVGTTRDFSYQNVLSARGFGAEGLVRWRSIHDWVAIEASATFQDLRNDSSSGPYASYAGDRLPNLPWLFAHAQARLAYHGLATPRDAVSLTWFTRYTHAFYRDWESIGAPQYKPTVDAQVAHSVTLAYAVRGLIAASFALDVQNVTNARLYDVYGVELPGRAFYGKTTLDF